jgi:signal recognition particle GTPase
MAKEVRSLQAELDKIEQPPTALPDLYDIRDRVLNNWKLAKRAESKQRLREFADKLIEAAITDDMSYTMMQRLLEELEQVRKFKRAGDQTALYWENQYRSAVAELKRRGVNWG